MKKNKRLGAIISASVLALIGGAGAIYFFYSKSRYGDLEAFERALPAESRNPDRSRVIPNILPMGASGKAKAKGHYFQRIYVLKMNLKDAHELLKQRLKGTKWIEMAPAQYGPGAKWDSIAGFSFIRMQASGRPGAGSINVFRGHAARTFGMTNMTAMSKDDQDNYSSILIVFGPIINDPLDNLIQSFSKNPGPDALGSP